MKQFLKKFILSDEKKNIKNEDYYDNYVVINILDESQFRLYVLLMSVLTKAYLDKDLNYENIEETITALFEKLRLLSNDNKMTMIMLMADVLEDFVYEVGVEELYGYDFELVALSLYNTYCQFVDTTFDDEFYYPLTYNELIKEYEEYLNKLEYKEETLNLEEKILPKKRGRLPAIKKLITRKHRGKYITYLTTVYKKPENMDERERKFYKDAYQRSFKRSINRDWLVSEYSPKYNKDIVVRHMRDFIKTKYNDEYNKYVDDYNKKITISDLRKAIIEERKRAYEEAGVSKDLIEILIKRDIEKRGLLNDKNILKMMKKWAENKALIDVVSNHIDEVAEYLNKALVNDLYLKGVSDEKIAMYMKDLNQFIDTIKSKISKVNNKDLYKTDLLVSRLAKSDNFSTVLTHTQTDNMYLTINKDNKKYTVELKHIGDIDLNKITDYIEKLVGKKYYDLISNKIKVVDEVDEKGRKIYKVNLNLDDFGGRRKIPVLQRIIYKYNIQEI